MPKYDQRLSAARKRYPYGSDACGSRSDAADAAMGETLQHPYSYFVHSYYVPLCEETIAKADYILPYSASLHKDNFYTCQFHPEKSGKVGEQILKNFLEIK